MQSSSENVTIDNPMPVLYGPDALPVTHVL